MTPLDVENPYLLLTPGPLSTSDSVRQSMFKDWCTWDDDYNQLVQSVRQDLVALATATAPEDYTAVLMQGSGTASVEATIGTALAQQDKLLILSNGAYGCRMADIARYLKIEHVELQHGELESLDLTALDQQLQNDPQISHVAVVHCETTTGRLNPVEQILPIIARYKRISIVDAMSSFGGLEMDVAQLGIDYLISSANKCIQGVPGFGFVIAKRQLMQTLEGRARSLSLDLYDQWQTMEKQSGKWRFTSPTHVVRAFRQALDELHSEGLQQRQQRFAENQRTLVSGMAELGYRTMVNGADQSPFITSFHYPENPAFSFRDFYQALKSRGFVIYPGKVSDADCFRIGTIGEVYPRDISRLLQAIADVSVAEDKLSVAVGQT